MYHLMVHSRHPELGGDLSYEALSVASIDSGYKGSSIAATSTHSTPRVVEHYQKMTIQPQAEGEL